MIINASNFGYQISAQNKLAAQTELSKKLEAGKIGAMFNFDTPSVIDETMKIQQRELSFNAKYLPEERAAASQLLIRLEKTDKELVKINDLVASATEDIYTYKDRETIQREIDGHNQAIDKIFKEACEKGFAKLAEPSKLADIDKFSDAEMIEQTLDSENLTMTDLQIDSSLYNQKESSKTSESNDNSKNTINTPENSLNSFFDKLGIHGNYTAAGLGTDKIDVSSAESAQKSLDIVSAAQGIVRDDMRKLNLVMIHSEPFELEVPEKSSFINKPTVIAGAMEFLKNNILEAEVDALLDNSPKNPERVAALLK